MGPERRLRSGSCNPSDCSGPARAKGPKGAPKRPDERPEMDRARCVIGRGGKGGPRPVERRPSAPVWERGGPVRRPDDDARGGAAAAQLVHAHQLCHCGGSSGGASRTAAQWDLVSLDSREAPREHEESTKRAAPPERHQSSARRAHSRRHARQLPAAQFVCSVQCAACSLQCAVCSSRAVRVQPPANSYWWSAQLKARESKERQERGPSEPFGAHF